MVVRKWLCVHECVCVCLYELVCVCVHMYFSVAFMREEGYLRNEKERERVRDKERGEGEREREERARYMLCGCVYVSMYGIC